MKKNTLLIGFLALLATNSLSAQDLVIETMKTNPNIELKDATFDAGYGNVGNTSIQSVICLGEVDFGTDGNTYKATGVEFGHGWGEFGKDPKVLVFHAGNTLEESTAFNELTLDRTYGYHHFETFAENMKEAEGFIRPVGKQKVWLTFRVGNGNLRSAIFYKDQITTEGMQPALHEQDGYQDKATIVDGSSFKRAVEPEDPEVDPFKDCKYDEQKRRWGGIVKDFIIKSNEPIDFGQGEFQQLVIYIGHNGERYKEYMEIYIDEVTPENMIARTWSGINLEMWDDFTPVATSLKSVTGSHHVFVKFGDATNLHRIDLLKENLWFENPDCGIQYVDIKPSENAVVYQTLGGQGATQGGDITIGEMEWDILVRGKNNNAMGEGQNIGYTSNGVVVGYYGVDFKKGEYKVAIVNHSCNENYLDAPIEECNFSLYIGLNDQMWDNVSTPEEVKAALEGHTPIAVIPVQGTGGWSEKMGTVGALEKVEGVHDVYVVYNLPDDAGANIYGLYLDPDDSPVGMKPSVSAQNLKVYSANGEIVVNASETVNIAIYTLNGIQVANETLSEGITTITNLSSGLHILRATGKSGLVSTYKLMVK